MNMEHRQEVNPRLPSLNEETTRGIMIGYGLAAIGICVGLGYYTAEQAAKAREELYARNRPQPAKGETAMKLTDRERWLMAQAYLAGDNNGVADKVNKGRRYSFGQWLCLDSGFKSGANMEEALLASAPPAQQAEAPTGRMPHEMPRVPAGFDATVERERHLLRTGELVTTNRLLTEIRDAITGARRAMDVRI